MSSISSEEIISILKSEIENFDSEATDKETGTVIWVGDGIATVYGIEHAMYGEIVVFSAEEAPDPPPKYQPAKYNPDYSVLQVMLVK